MTREEAIDEAVRLYFDNRLGQMRLASWSRRPWGQVRLGIRSYIAGCRGWRLRNIRAKFNEIASRESSDEIWARQQAFYGEFV